MHGLLDFLFIIPQFSHSISIKLKKQRHANKEAFGDVHTTVESLLKANISKVIILSCNGKQQKWVSPQKPICKTQRSAMNLRQMKTTSEIMHNNLPKMLSATLWALQNNDAMRTKSVSRAWFNWSWQCWYFIQSAAYTHNHEQPPTNPHHHLHLQGNC